MKVELNDDQVDGVVVEELKNYYDSLAKDIAGYYSEVNSHYYYRADYKAILKDMKAIKRVLRYYMGFKEWSDEVA